MSTDSKAKEIPIHFVKSTQFRVIHVDGAWGGISPSGYVQMAVYSQRGPIPQSIIEVLNISGQNKVESVTEIESRRVGKSGILREIEADLLMDLPTAKAVHSWLGKKIEELQKEHEKQPSK